MEALKCRQYRRRRQHTATLYARIVNVCVMHSSLYGNILSEQQTVYYLSLCLHESLARLNGLNWAYGEMEKWENEIKLCIKVLFCFCFFYFFFFVERRQDVCVYYMYNTQRRKKRFVFVLRVTGFIKKSWDFCSEWETVSLKNGLQCGEQSAALKQNMNRRRKNAFACLWVKT